MGAESAMICFRQARAEMRPPLAPPHDPILFDPKFRRLELTRDVRIYFIRKDLNGFGEPRHMPHLRDLPSSHPSSQEASGRLPLYHERSGAPSRR
jgi:hypothetical protein